MRQPVKYEGRLLEYICTTHLGKRYCRNPAGRVREMLLDALSLMIYRASGVGVLVAQTSLAS